MFQSSMECHTDKVDKFDRNIWCGMYHYYLTQHLSIKKVK